MTEGILWFFVDNTHRSTSRLLAEKAAYFFLHLVEVSKEVFSSARVVGLLVVAVHTTGQAMSISSCGLIIVEVRRSFDRVKAIALYCVMLEILF